MTYLRDLRKLPGAEQSFVVPSGIWVNPEYEGLAASPDFMVFDSREDLSNQLGLLEVKCPYNLKDCSPWTFQTTLTKQQQYNFCLKEENGKVVLKKTHPYHFQVQMQMAITKLSWCDLMIYSEHGYIKLRIRYDEELWSQMQPKLHDFYKNFMLPEMVEMRIPRGLLPLNLSICNNN